ncbi:spermine/spermidine synthase domain-containing protein [Hirsutella rhossiliensis]|uniref:Spermine/spermidine synthase domain-containing protein n=1 Tax=Hirsutella rhossiliensis TaxID=111463 RepID=A0A9P8SES7_9HYPO|nr:spermine/spermidine synthase domain-containing protein [Hirsutella rhossiliensis]KAH0958685.1 spermine/spermidine synthase domain-containing protein [Hirsutella rhossiliensis]
MPAKDTRSEAAASAEGFTPERFEKELKELATKARNDTWTRRAARQLSAYAKAAFLLALLAVYSNVSPLALSPVYGSIPATIWHSKLLMTSCFVGWAGNVALRQFLPVRTALFLPLVALYIPAVQWFLLGYSSLLGPRWGPVVTEAVTLFPLAVLTAAVVADHLETTRLKMLPAFVADAAPGLGSWAWLKFVEQFAANHLRANMGRAVLYTRLGLELALGVVYAVFVPSKLLAYAVPPLLHALLFNTHVPSPAATSSLVSSMMTDGWLLLDRRESVTGYVSVLQSMQDGFRVMRCDHSLLGGDWIDKRQSKLPEPIYGVFVMLEAVRLAETETPVPDKDAHALVVGLGVGTTPSALVTHGINTTVVEIDPAVYDYAAKYFDLKENNPPVLEDAVGYTSALTATAPETFDYIVHDVFTGGAEPVDLFTLEFLQGLATLLKPNGVVAINYAGDLALPAPGIVFRTIKHVFPTCRIFREVPRDDVALKEVGVDFANMVIFCTKTSSPLTFRMPTQADHLQSAIRQEFLRLQHEIPQTELLSGDDASILRKNDTGALVAWHEQSALGHWAIMRTVLPAWVWERW